MKRIIILATSALLGIASVVFLISTFRGIAKAASNLPAGEIHVCLSGCTYNNIQAAVNSASNGDVIKVAAGTYTDVHRYPYPAPYYGSNIITQVVYINKSVTIRGGYTTSDWELSNPAANPTILDAQKRGRVIFMVGNIHSTLAGFSLVDGDATGLGGDPGSNGGDAGGGVYVITATATISDNQIYGNSASFGVGLYLNNTYTKLLRNMIHDNHTTPEPGGPEGFAHSGGGLFIVDSNVELSENIIQSNTATYDGGGLAAVLSNITMTSNSIISNTSKRGGGVILGASTTRLNNNTIAHNIATESGGGICLRKGDNQFDSNTIQDNHAMNGWGGGLDISNATIVLNGNTIADNSATIYGGGISLFRTYYNNCQAIIIGNRIINNQSPGGGGARVSDCESTIIDNQIISNTGGGLYFGHNYETNSRISRNSIRGNIGSGLSIGPDGYAVLIDNNLIADNATTGNGGGISMINSGQATLSGNIVMNNFAGLDGGGLYAQLTPWYVVNNVFLRNRADRSGSGIFIYGGPSGKYDHNTIAQNTGGDGSGINIISWYGNPSILTFNNTIIVSQTVGISVSTNCQANLNGILWFDNLQNAGGVGTITKSNEHTGNPDFTSDGYHLMTNSSAINAGIPLDLHTDIDSEPRPYQEYDLGADEFWPPGVLKHIYFPLIKR